MGKRAGGAKRVQGRVGSSAEEKGPAEAVASLGKPQTCWSWTLLQVPQAPGGPKGTSVGQGESRVKNLWENPGTWKNFTPFSPVHVSLLPSRRQELLLLEHLISTVTP